MKEHELRKRIKREKIQEQMPESTRKRMDDLLDGLPEETKRSKIHRTWKKCRGICGCIIFINSDSVCRFEIDHIRNRKIGHKTWKQAISKVCETKRDSKK